MRLSTVLLFCAIMLFGWRHYTARRSTQLSPAYEQFLKAYPDIKSIEHDHAVWRDGTKMPLRVPQDETLTHHRLNNPTLADQIEQATYNVGDSAAPPRTDPGRIRYEPFFRKMYGNSPQEVERNLERVVWMPNVFGKSTYVLRVTRINNVHERIKAISDELEKLVAEHPEYKKYLEHPGGTFNWRTIANTNRLSGHSFGMTIDLNVAHSHYWQWDLKKEKRPISEDAELTYHNAIPWDIVSIFERHGFIWGGKWYHYDTMHFEYRPELMIAG